MRTAEDINDEISKLVKERNNLINTQAKQTKLFKTNSKEYIGKYFINILNNGISFSKVIDIDIVYSGDIRVELLQIIVNMPHIAIMGEYLNHDHEESTVKENEYAFYQDDSFIGSPNLTLNNSWCSLKSNELPAGLKLKELPPNAVALSNGIIMLGRTISIEFDSWQHVFEAFSKPISEKLFNWAAEQMHMLNTIIFETFSPLLTEHGGDKFKSLINAFYDNGKHNNEVSQIYNKIDKWLERFPAEDINEQTINNILGKIKGMPIQEPVRKLEL